MKFHNPMVVQSFSLQRGVTFTLNSCLGTQDDPGVENIVTDLLVLGEMANCRLPAVEALDAKLGGKVAAALADVNFTGQAGESVLVKVNDPAASQKYILVIGLGDIVHYNGRSVCGFTRKVLEVAKELGVEKISIPFFPNRQTEEKVCLAATAATMVCRVTMFIPSLPNLKEIEIISTPQARRHLQDGLFGRTPRCIICTNPELGHQS